MGYIAPRRERIEEDVAQQRRERRIAYAVLVPLFGLAILMFLAMVALR